MSEPIFILKGNIVYSLYMNMDILSVETVKLTEYIRHFHSGWEAIRSGITVTV